MTRRHVPVTILTSLRRFRFVALTITLCLAGAGFLAHAGTGARAAALRPAHNTLRAFGGGSRSAARSPIKHFVGIYLAKHSFHNLLWFSCHPHPGRSPDGRTP